MTVAPPSVETVVLSPAANAAFTTPYGSVQSCRSRSLSAAVAGVAVPFPAISPAPISDSSQA